MVSALLVACSAGGARKPGWEVQTFQKNSFECSERMAFKSVLSVFQDLGYLVRSADVNSGVITASSPTRNRTLLASQMRTTEAVAVIEPLGGDRCSVRINLVEVIEKSTLLGRTSRANHPIELPEPYTDAFIKIREAVFLRSRRWPKN